MVAPSSNARRARTLSKPVALLRTIASPVLLLTTLLLLVPAGAFVPPYKQGRSRTSSIMMAAGRAAGSSQESTTAAAATTRRGVLGQGAGLALLSGALLGNVGGAVAASGTPEVTDKVYFDVAIGGETVGRLTFGLFGKEAPVVTGNFLRVLDGKAQGASYDFSSIWRVQKDTCIDLGRVTGGGGKKLQKNINESGYMRISAANAADWTSNTEVNSLRHTEPFLLTTKRGGGTYEFSLTLNPNKDLDKDHVVFGKLDQSDPAAKAENERVVQAILAVPVSTDDPIQSKKLFSSAGKGFDPRAKIIYLYKPLKKIQVRGTGRV